MKTYTLDDLQNNLDDILYSAASGREAARVQVTEQLNAIIIDESEWRLLCDAFDGLAEAKRVVAHG